MLVAMVTSLLLLCNKLKGHIIQQLLNLAVIIEIAHENICFYCYLNQSWRQQQTGLAKKTSNLRRRNSGAAGRVSQEYISL